MSVEKTQIPMHGISEVKELISQDKLLTAKAYLVITFGIAPVDAGKIVYELV